ncbi:MAG: hypothetical protein HYX47_16075 [Burkholderiales bacterium]|nr:hypothetical protein [Burkholderiales bacterium]
MSFMTPGIALMHHLPNQRKLPLLAAAFTLPTVILVFYARLPLAAEIAVAASWLLAVYAIGSFYLQANEGWGRLIAVIQRIGGGDLTATINTGLNGHFGQMMRELEGVKVSLSQIVSQTRESANAVSQAAAAAAGDNANLSQRTDQQAATLEQTASGMEELSSTVKQNADNCKKADELAHAAAGTARQGAEAVQKVVQSMGTIDASSRQIVDIIGMIEGITFQTNILALNAAVEAARAGEQGRGFAVVANEVRNLAHRSAQAAKDIKTLIDASVSQISDGSKNAQAAGKVIGEIVGSVQQVTNVIGEIAAASGEQSAGLEEMNRAVMQMEHATQQNARLVQDAASSSQSLQQQSDRLAQLVSRFKLREEAAPQTQQPRTGMSQPPAPRRTGATMARLPA